MGDAPKTDPDSGTGGSSSGGSSDSGTETSSTGGSSDSGTETSSTGGGSDSGMEGSNAGGNSVAGQSDFDINLDYMKQISYEKDGVTVGGRMGFIFRYDEDQCIFDLVLDSGTVSITMEVGFGWAKTEKTATWTPMGIGFDVSGDTATASTKMGVFDGKVILERTGASCCFDKWTISLEVSVTGFSSTVELGDVDLTEKAAEMGVKLCVR